MIYPMMRESPYLAEIRRASIRCATIVRIVHLDAWTAEASASNAKTLAASGAMPEA